MKHIHIKNWKRFQHYRDRNPKWIKLHLSILDDYEFQTLTPTQQLVLIKLWLLSARSAGRLPVDSAWLARNLHIDYRAIAAALPALETNNFITLSDKSASQSVPKRSRPTSLETDNKRERKEKDTGYSAEFEKAWQAYPSRGGHPNPKKAAWQKYAALLKAGVAVDEIERGFVGYAEFCRRENTEPKFIKQAVTFLNQELWRDYQPAAASKPIVVPPCWQNGLAPVAAKAGPNLRSLLYPCIPKIADQTLILMAPTKFVADQLRGKHSVELSKVWAGEIVVMENSLGAAA